MNLSYFYVCICLCNETCFATFIFACIILTEGSTIIPLCVVPHYQEPLQVQPFMAAVLKDEFDKYVTLQWDLTTLRVNNLNLLIVLNPNNNSDLFMNLFWIRFYRT